MREGGGGGVSERASERAGELFRAPADAARMLPYVKVH